MNEEELVQVAAKWLQSPFRSREMVLLRLMHQHGLTATHARKIIRVALPIARGDWLPNL